MYIYTDSLDNTLYRVLNYYTRKLGIGICVSIEGTEHLKSGIGKSYTGMKVGELSDPQYREGTQALDKIAFKPRDFEKAMDIVEEEGYPGQYVQVDEAGLLVNRKKWYSFINNAMADAVATMRNLQGIVGFVTPSVWRVEKDIREYIALLFKCNKRVVEHSDLYSADTMVETKIWRCFWDEHKNKLFRYGITIYNKEDGRPHVLRKFYPTLPNNPELVYEYEKRAKKYKREARRILRDMGKEEMTVQDWVAIVLDDNKIVKREATTGLKKVIANDIRYEYDLSADLARTVARKLNEKFKQEGEQQDAPQQGQ